MRLGRAFRSQEDPSARGRIVSGGRGCAAGRVLSSGARLRGLARAVFGSARLCGPGPSVSDPLDSLAPTLRSATNQPPAQLARLAQPQVRHQPTRRHLLRYPSLVDKNRRYVSLPTPRRRRVQKVRSCDLAFCGNAATLLIGQLENGSHIDEFCPRRGSFARKG